MKAGKPGNIYELIASIDRTVHEPSRMAVLTLLLTVKEADFVFIKSTTGLSQGNLSSHLSKMEEEGLVIIIKSFKGKRPHTSVKISPEGEKRFNSYLGKMKDFYSSIS